MAEAAGFGAGFAKGFSQALLSSRERADARAKEDRTRQDQLFLTLLPKVFEEGMASGDTAGVEDFLQRYPEYLGGGAGGGKTGARGKKSAGAGTGPLDNVRGVLQRVFGIQRQMGGGGGQATASTAAPSAAAPVVTPDAAAALPVRDATTQGIPDFDRQPSGVPIPGQMPMAAIADAVAPTATATPPSPTLFGVHLQTSEQKAERATQAQITAQDTIDAADLRRRRQHLAAAGPNLLSPDEQAEYLLTGKFTRLRPSAEPYAAVHGTVPDSTDPNKRKEVSAVFNQAKGFYEDATTHQPLVGFVQTAVVSPEAAQARADAATAKADAAKAKTDEAAATAEMVADNPSLLQTLTPTVASSVMGQLAKYPALRTRYETARMAPIRATADTILTTMKDLLQFDDQGKVTGLSGGAANLYGAHAGRLARFVPGSAAATAKAALDQITGQLALDTISNMKAQSRTGATGFGQLSARELSVLETAASVLKGEISPERALAELTKLYDRYQKILQPSAMELAAQKAGAGAGGKNVGAATPAAQGTTPPTGIRLDTPIFIGPDGKPSLAAPASTR